MASSGPELEAEAEFREVGSYGLIVTEVVVWLPRLVTAEAVNESSLFTCSPAFVHLYCQPHKRD